MRGNPPAPGAARPVTLALAAAALAWWLAAPSVCSADPLALRHALHTRGAVVDAGYPTLSAGVWITPAFGVAVDVRIPGSAIGVSAGTRRIPGPPPLPQTIHHSGN